MLGLFSQPPASSVEEVFTSLEKEDAAIIDVREIDEYKEGHAKGAKSYPLSTLDEKVAEELKKYKDVYVICRSGGRSARATTLLRKCGVNATNITGGTMAWTEKGLPMEK